MAEYFISPPNTQFVNTRTGFLTAEAYRFLSQGNRQGNGFSQSGVITITNEQVMYPNSRALAVTTGELTRTVGDPNLTLGLADTAVTPGTYGSASRIFSAAIDSKGRTIAAANVRINVSDVDGKLLAVNGGTGLDLYAVGDLLVADTTTTLVQFSDVAVGSVLLSGGVGALPVWGQVDLSTSVVTGVLPAANGGFPAGGYTGSIPFPITALAVANGLITGYTP